MSGISSWFFKESLRFVAVDPASPTTLVTAQENDCKLCCRGYPVDEQMNRKIFEGIESVPTNAISSQAARRSCSTPMENGSVMRKVTILILFLACLMRPVGTAAQQGSDEKLARLEKLFANPPDDWQLRQYGIWRSR